MRPSALVLGYHGCDRAIGERLVGGSEEIRESRNSYDWLGHGSYFWENSPQRALEWAGFLKAHPRPGRNIVTETCVVGAVIELGNCLDLTEAESLDLIRAAYDALKRTFDAAGATMPENRPGRSRDENLILRNRDCAVINFLHKLREDGKLEPFETVRGAFFEGNDLYEGAGIKAKTHIQVCVRNPKRIRGFFWPRQV